MSESFKRILRTKTAEQLTNMVRSKDSWSPVEHELIKQEVANRGLEIFEEPQEWSDDEMEKINLASPKTDFEKDMAFLTNEKNKINEERGVRLASQIVSISAVIISFSFLYWYIQNLNTNGISLLLKLGIGAVMLGIAGLILFVSKRLKLSLIASGASLILTVIVLILTLQELL